MIEIHVYRAIFPAGRLTAKPESPGPVETFQIWKDGEVITAGITAEKSEKPYELANEIGETFPGARKGFIELVIAPYPPQELGEIQKNSSLLLSLRKDQIAFLKKNFEIAPYDENYPDEAYPETGSV